MGTPHLDHPLALISCILPGGSTALASAAQAAATPWQQLPSAPARRAPLRRALAAQGSKWDERLAAAQRAPGRPVTGWCFRLGAPPPPPALPFPPPS